MSTIVLVILSVAAFWFGGIKSRADLIIFLLRRVLPLLPSLVAAAKSRIPDELEQVLAKIAPEQQPAKTSKAKK